MLTLTRPTEQRIRQFIEQQGALPFTYPDVGATRHDTPPVKYAIDRNEVQLGMGAETFNRAKAAVTRWEMFNMPWVTLCYPNAPIQAGITVALLARALNIYFLNACRIVYVIDEPRRFGFAYGTLPAHIERGEERFLVEWREDDTVWYTIIAYSKPQMLLAKMGYPYVRMRQKAFARASKAAMVATTKG